ncbi:MAG: SpoIID/LytB domain-containing protein [Thermodesulfovibrionales bacterium]
MLNKCKILRFLHFKFLILYFAFSSISIIPSVVYPLTTPVRIKVLITDENFSSVPEKDERLQKMGNMKGDLLVNGSHYTGNIEVWKGDRGLYLINELSLEDYVESVVAAEVGTSWEIEALKAQAVIARTYAVYKKAGNGNNRFHLTSSVLHQVYKGNSSHIQITYAVKSTAGEVLTYNGMPIEAFYHSTCGGRTEDPEEVFGKSYPYLRPVESNCELSPYWVWERKIPVMEIEKALNIKEINGISINSHTSTGRVRDLTIKSKSGRMIIKATELRRLLGWSRLPSTNFKMKMNGDSIIFEGKGYGHGVGLCQWSALQMAREGKNYREILSFFYPGTEIRIYEGD